MARKKKHRQRKHNKPATKPPIVASQPLLEKPQPDGRLLARLSKKAVIWFLGICTVLGVLLWGPFYVARIRIDIASSSINPLRPLPVSFSVTNHGVFNAYSIEFICYAIKIYAGSSVMVHNMVMGPRPLADILPGNESVENTCSSIILSPSATEADIEFLVSFQPAYTWKRSYTCARFEVKKNAHGAAQWFRTQPHACKTQWLQFEKERQENKMRQQGKPKEPTIH